MFGLQSASWAFVQGYGVGPTPAQRRDHEAQQCQVLSGRASARNGEVPIFLRLLHKFHRVNRLLAFALALHV